MAKSTKKETSKSVMTEQLTQENKKAKEYNEDDEIKTISIPKCVRRKRINTSSDNRVLTNNTFPIGKYIIYVDEKEIITRSICVGILANAVLVRIISGNDISKNIYRIPFERIIKIE